MEKASFSFKKGVYNVLIGKNGTGKSTVLKMLIGLEKINSGKIYIEEEEISYKKEELYKIRNKTGVLF